MKPSNTTPSVLFYTYVLESSKDDNRYIGITNDLKRRLEEHNKGVNKSTKYRRPFHLIYFEACLDKDDAMQREEYLKNTVGRRYITKRLRNYYRSSVTG